MDTKKTLISLLLIVAIVLCGDPQIYTTTSTSSMLQSDQGPIDGSFIVDKVDDSLFGQ